MQNVFVTLVKTQPSSKIQSKSPIQSQQKSSSLNKNKEILQEKQNILDYMMTEATECVDLNKCQDLYTKSNYQLISLSSNLFRTISMKKEKLSSLDKLIEKEIINEVHIDANIVEEYYQQKIEALKNEIIMKKREKSQYMKYEKEKIINNNASKKKLNNETSIEVINDKTHEKYQVISLKARRSLKSQEINHNNLIEYEKNFREHYENEIEKKKNTYNFLDYQVFKIKSNNIGLESMLEHLKKKSKNLQEKIALQKKKMKQIVNEIKIIKKDLLLDRVIINKICSGFKAKSIDDAIAMYKDDNIIKEKNSVQFKILNATVSELKNELKEITLKKQNILECYNKCTNDRDLDNENIHQENECFTNLEKDVNLIKQFIGFIDGNNKKMIKLVNCIKKKKTSNKTKHISLEKVFNSKIFNDIVKLVMKMLLEFMSNFYFLYYHFLSYLSLNNISHPNGNTNLSMNKIIYDLNSETIQHIMDDQTKTALFRLEKKNKLLARTEEEIFQLNQSFTQDDRKKKEVEKQKKTIDNVFQNYLEFNKKKGNDLRNESNLETLKPKIIKHISKYTNEFVVGIGEKNICKKMIRNNKSSNHKEETPNIFKDKKIKKELFKKFKYFFNDSKTQDEIDNHRVHTDFNIPRNNEKKYKNFNSISRKHDINYLEKTLIQINNDPPTYDSNAISIKLKHLNKKSADSRDIKKLRHKRDLTKYQVKIEKDNKEKKNEKISLRTTGLENSDNLIHQRITDKNPISLKHARRVDYLNELFDDKFLQNTNKEIENLKTTSSYFGIKNPLNYSTDLQSIKSITSNKNLNFTVNFKKNLK